MYRKPLVVEVELLSGPIYRTLVKKSTTGRELICLVLSKFNLVSESVGDQLRQVAGSSGKCSTVFGPTVCQPISDADFWINSKYFGLALCVSCEYENAKAEQSIYESANSNSDRSVRRYCSACSRVRHDVELSGRPVRRRRPDVGVDAGRPWLTDLFWIMDDVKVVEKVWECVKCVRRSITTIERKRSGSSLSRIASWRRMNNPLLLGSSALSLGASDEALQASSRTFSAANIGSVKFTLGDSGTHSSRRSTRRRSPEPTTKVVRLKLLIRYFPLNLLNFSRNSDGALCYHYAFLQLCYELGSLPVRSISKTIANQLENIFAHILHTFVGQNARSTYIDQLIRSCQLFTSLIGQESSVDSIVSNWTNRLKEIYNCWQLETGSSSPTEGRSCLTAILSISHLLAHVSYSSLLSVSIDGGGGGVGGVGGGICLEQWKFLLGVGGQGIALFDVTTLGIIYRCSWRRIARAEYEDKPGKLIILLSDTNVSSADPESETDLSESGLNVPTALIEAQKRRLIELGVTESWLARNTFELIRLVHSYSMRERRLLPGYVSSVFGTNQTSLWPSESDLVRHLDANPFSLDPMRCSFVRCPSYCMPPLYGFSEHPPVLKMIVDKRNATTVLTGSPLSTFRQWCAHNGHVLDCSVETPVSLDQTSDNESPFLIKSESQQRINELLKNDLHLLEEEERCLAMIDNVVGALRARREQLLQLKSAKEQLWVELCYKECELTHSMPAEFHQYSRRFQASNRSNLPATPPSLPPPSTSSSSSAAAAAAATTASSSSSSSSAVQLTTPPSSPSLADEADPAIDGTVVRSVRRKNSLPDQVLSRILGNLRLGPGARSTAASRSDSANRKPRLGLDNGGFETGCSAAGRRDPSKRVSYDLASGQLSVAPVANESSTTSSSSSSSSSSSNKPANGPSDDESSMDSPSRIDLNDLPTLSPSRFGPKRQSLLVDDLGDKSLSSMSSRSVSSKSTSSKSTSSKSTTSKSTYSKSTSSKPTSSKSASSPSSASAPVLPSSPHTVRLLAGHPARIGRKVDDV